MKINNKFLMKKYKLREMNELKLTFLNKVY